MTLPDWVLNGTTYKDLGTVGDFSMMWNFNTREKARLTGGLLANFFLVCLAAVLSGSARMNGDWRDCNSPL